VTVRINEPGSGGVAVALCAAPADAVQVVSVLDVPLGESWNLMSSFVDPLSQDVTLVQLPISGTYTVIQGFDQGARSYYPDLPPGINTLDSMDAEHGYWIKAKAGISPTLRTVGAALAETYPISLTAGWNLVSYLPRQPMSVTVALASIAVTYSAVLGFDHGALSFYPDLPDEMNTLKTLDPLHGYWIKATEPVTLVYPATMGTAPAGAPPAQLVTLASETTSAARLRSLERASGVSPTNTWVNFFGSARRLNGAPLPIATTVLAVDPNGVVCGAAVVNQRGAYGVLACYGDDPRTPSDEGAVAGDVIRIVADGVVLGRGMWTAPRERQWVPLGLLDVQYRYLPYVTR
jgi:hypothetical protein